METETRRDEKRRAGGVLDKWAQCRWLSMA